MEVADCPWLPQPIYLMQSKHKREAKNNKLREKMRLPIGKLFFWIRFHYESMQFFQRQLHHNSL